MDITSVSVTPQEIDMKAAPGTPILFTVIVQAWGPLGPDKERYSKGFESPDCTYEKAMLIIDSYRRGKPPAEVEAVK